MGSDLPAETAVQLKARFDCVVMVTWSDWPTEGRKNRYQYGIRFARHLPVIFIQADLTENTWYFESTEIENLNILHVVNDPWHYDRAGPLNQILLARGYRRPLLWCYSFDLLDFIARRWSPFRVYHATEDYFDRYAFPFNEIERLRLIQTVEGSDLLIAVSRGVLDSYLKHVRPRGESIVVPNGCDFDFWKPPVDVAPRVKNHRTALYQGMITDKLDFALLHQIVEALPDWEFCFCGPIVRVHDEFAQLRTSKNVRYLGHLAAEEVRTLSWDADVGLIPFLDLPWLRGSALPLKAFEYVAAGLPAVMTPIDALAGHPTGVFWTARTAQEFVRAIRDAAATRYDPSALANRAAIARQQDYDTRFAEVCRQVVEAASHGGSPFPRRFDASPRHVAVVYGDDGPLDFIRRLADHSCHRVRLAAASDGPQDDMQDFDAMILTLSPGGLLEGSWRTVHEQFGGLKVALLATRTVDPAFCAQAVESLGIQIVVGPHDGLAALGERLPRFVDTVSLPPIADAAIERIDALISSHVRTLCSDPGISFGFDASFRPGAMAPLGSLAHGRCLGPAASAFTIHERYAPLDETLPPLPDTFHISATDRTDAALRLAAAGISPLDNGVVFLISDDLRYQGRVHWQARRAAEQGHSVCIVGFRSGTEPATEVRDGVTVLRLEPSVDSRALLPASPAVLVSAFVTGQAPYAALGGVPPPPAADDPLFLQAPPAYAARDMARLSQMVRNNVLMFSVARALRPIAVHSHEIETMLAGVRLKHELGCRLVHETSMRHSMVPRLVSSWAVDYLAALGRTLSAWPDAWISASETRLSELGGPARSAVQPAYPAVPALPPVPVNARPTVVYHGPLEKGANLERVLQMVRHLPGVFITLRGEGSWRKALVEYAKRLGIASRVDIEALPRTAEGRVRAAQSATMAIVAPIPDRAGTVLEPPPQTFFEYLHAGLPVLVSVYLVDLARRVQEEEIGMVTRPEDLPGMLKAARAILGIAPDGDRESAARMRANALSAAGRCRWETVADVPLMHYRS